MPSTSVHIKGSESVSTAAKNAGGAIHNLAQQVKATVQPVRDLANSARELLQFGGAAIMARQLYNALADCEAQFIKLNPQLANAKGSANELKKAWDGLKASFGGGLNQTISPARGWLSEQMNSVSQFGTFMRINQYDLAKAMIDYWKIGGEKILGIFKITTQAIKSVFDTMIYSVKSAFQDAMNWMLDQSVAMMAKIYSWPIWQKLGMGDFAKAMTMISGSMGRFNIAGQAPVAYDPGAAYQALTADINKRLNEVLSTWVASSMSAAVQTQEFMNALDGATAATVEWSSSIGGPVTQDLEAGNPQWRGRGSKFGASQKHPAAEKGVSPVLGGLDILMSAFSSLTGNIASINILLDPLKVIFDAMFQTLAPMVNQILQPIIGILVILGQTIGQILMPVLLFLAPIIEAVAKGFAWFYNAVIMPIGNFIFKVFTWVGNLILNFGQVIGFLVTHPIWEWGGAGKAATHELDWNKIIGPLKAITYGALSAAGAGYMDQQGGGGAGYGSNTTVQRVPDIYVYMTFEGNVVGKGGMSEVGKYVVDGIKAYLGTGARVEFLEN
jgi:hypothetical protein